MSSLTACFEDVQARLGTTLGALGEKLPNMGLGENAKFKHETPPRIVWVPTGGPVSKPKQAGGDQRSNPRQLWLRALQLEARIWHADIKQTEGLANHMVAAMHEALSGGYKILGETWDTLGATQLGVQLVLTMSIDLPFTDEVSATTKPTSATVTSQFASG
jgi:hypothetical protein